MSHEVRLLGPWEVRGGHGDVQIPAGQLRVLLTALVLSANQTVALDTLAVQLWPEQSPMRVRGSLHTYVGRLRKLLGPDLIRTQPGGYQLTIAVEAVDLLCFRDLLRQAREAGTPERELELLRDALRLWRGTPFADIHSTWLDREVVPALTEEWFAAIGRRIELELATGQTESVIAELRGLTGRYPTRESLWLQLITALYRAGRRADALSAYQQVRVVLRDELGIEPGEALVALQREILLEGGDNSGQPRPPVVPRQLPHDIRAFTGRTEELATLEGLVTNTADSPVPTIVSIDGAPGVGKTTLAVHWAHRIAYRYPDAQLYLNLRGYGLGEPLPPEVAAEMLLRALGVPSERIPSEKDERSALLRSALSGRSVLILLDNACAAEQVRPLLPGTGGLVIVTSRERLPDLSIKDGAHRVTLHPLPPRQSVELLAAAVGHGWVAEEPVAAADLVELCDRLPLALAIVAERAHRAGSLAEVVAELIDEQARLDMLDNGEDTSLRAALSGSYRALRPEAAAMFRKLGLHPASDIEVRTAAALADAPVTRARAMLDQLVSAHLVERRWADRYELHDLIRLYASEMAGLDSDDARQAAVGRVLDWYLHAAVNADNTLIPNRRRSFLGSYTPRVAPLRFGSSAEATAWFEQEYECLRSVVAWAAGNGFAGHAWRIAVSMTSFLHHKIPWNDGVEFLRSAIAAAETAGERIGEAYAHNCVASIYLDTGDPDSALSHFQQAYVHFQALSHGVGEAMTLGNLALAQGQRGNDVAARYYAMRALNLHEAQGYPRGIAQNLDNLGLAAMVAGKYDSALEYFQQALTAVAGVGDREVEAWSRHHLAQAYSHLRDFPNATRAYRQSIGLHRTLGNRRWEAIVMADFATTLIDAGHPKLAEALLRHARTILTEFADPRVEEILALMP